MGRLLGFKPGFILSLIVAQCIRPLVNCITRNYTCDIADGDSASMLGLGRG